MTARRSLEDTRAELLAAGAQLLAEQGAGVTLDQIRLIDVCRRAGLRTAGSAYKIWATQDEFHNDLLHHLLISTSARLSTIALLDDMLDDAAGGPTLEGLTDMAAASNTARLRATFPTYLALWLARRTDPALDRSAQKPEALRTDALSDFLAKIMDHYGLEFVPPFDLAALTVTLSALTQGTMIRLGTTPELVADEIIVSVADDGTTRRTTPVAFAMQAILDTFTRPRT